MKRIKWDDPIWKTEIKIETDEIFPEKSLYWLSGGDEEWIKLENYTDPWNECYSYFEEEFGNMIIQAVKDSRTLLDIRNFFTKHLNLPILYDFAIKMNLVK